MALVMGRKERERQKLNRAAMNYHYENEETRFSHDTPSMITTYDKIWRNLRMFCSTRYKKVGTQNFALVVDFHTDIHRSNI